MIRLGVQTGTRLLSSVAHPVSAMAFLKSSVFTALLKSVVKDLPLLRLRARTAVSGLAATNLDCCIQRTNI